jgi:16S rRNA (uracil1498-N3)-methyltransferase
MIQFFAPDIETTLTLPQSDSQHCVKVLRKVPGDLIEVIDGKGNRFSCRLLEAHPKRATVEIIEKTPLPLFWPNRIAIGVAPTKHLDRMEWLTEKLTEIGVNSITPLLCRYSERKEIKAERLEKIAISAMKQSLKAVCPRIDEMTPFQKFIESVSDYEQKFIAHCDDKFERKLFCKEYKPEKDVVIIIGPEGDFSPQEIEIAIANGFVPVSLGEARLRTETAALVACDTCHIINEFSADTAK